MQDLYAFNHLLSVVCETNLTKPLKKGVINKQIVLDSTYLLYFIDFRSLLSSFFTVFCCKSLTFLGVKIYENIEKC